MIRRIVPAVLLACASGCAPVETDSSWLFIVAGDTVTVEEAAAHWDSLAPGELRVFDGSEDLKGDYVRAYSRMFLIRSELRSQGYLDRPGFVVQREALARIMMMNAMQDSILAGAYRSVTGEETGAFLADLEMSVVVTLSGPDGERTVGPVPLPELPREAVEAIRGMGIGATTTLSDGRTMRLQSLLRTDPALVENILADSSQAESYARTSLARLGASAGMDALLDTLWDREGADLRLPAISRLSAYCGSGTGLVPDDTMFTSATGTWTASRLLDEIDCESTMRLVEPADSNWTAGFCRTLVARNCLAGEYVRRFPAESDLILSAARGEVMQSAAESLYHTSVVDGIVITSARIDSAYAASPPLIEEKRIVQAFVIPADRTEEFDAAVRPGGPGIQPGTFENLFAGDPASGGESPPLSRMQFPVGLGDSVFALSDTVTWVGPVPLGTEPGSPLAAMRLLRILPARTAERDEAEYDLTASIRSAMLESRLEAWLEELALRAGLQVNRALLESLPDDPGAWSDL